MRWLGGLVLLGACGVEFEVDTSLGGAQEVFTRYCAKECHRGPEPDGKLSLEPGRSRLELVDVTTVAYCGVGGVRVVPGDPEVSCLWSLVRSDIMPLQQRPLAPVYKRTIYDWIVAGAPE